MINEVKIGTICNNNCIFCLNDNKNTDIPLETLKKNIHDLINSDITCIQFTGGEITIRKDFFELLNYTKKQGFDIHLQTNGRAFFYKEFAKKTINLGAESFLISLHSHNEELNKKLTGVQNGYKQTIEGIKNLIKLNQRVSIQVVITSENITHLPKIIKHHINLNPSLIQISWVRGAGKVIENNQLIPKYSDHMNKVFACVDMANKHKQKIVLIGFPICILKGYETYLGRPYQHVMLKDKNTMKKVEIKANRINKNKISECNSCELKSICGGIRKDYLKKYGSSEFKKPNKDRILKKIIESNLGEEVIKLKKLKKGFSATNYLIKTKSNKFFFMKERTYPAQQVEKEELLRNFFHKLKIPIVKRLYLSEFLGNPLEFFNMIDYDDYETKNMKPNSIIELAKLIGIIHSKSPVENRETDNIEGIYRFITQTDTFTSNELALIQLHKKNIDQKKSELKVCLIHNDLHDGNILIKNNKITGIVDFEKCKNYYCAWDVARALSSIGYHYKKALILYHNLEIFLREYKKWVNKKELSVLHSMTIFSTIEHLLNTLIFEERSGICKKNESKMILEKTKLFLNDDEFKNIFTKICY